MVAHQAFGSVRHPRRCAPGFGRSRPASGGQSAGAYRQRLKLRSDIRAFSNINGMPLARHAAIWLGQSSLSTKQAASGRQCDRNRANPRGHVQRRKPVQHVAGQTVLRNALVQQRLGRYRAGRQQYLRAGDAAPPGPAGSTSFLPRWRHASITMGRLAEGWHRYRGVPATGRRFLFRSLRGGVGCSRSAGASTVAAADQPVTRAPPVTTGHNSIRPGGSLVQRIGDHRAGRSSNRAEVHSIALPHTITPRPNGSGTGIRSQVLS